MRVPRVCAPGRACVPVRVRDWNASHDTDCIPFHLQRLYYRSLSAVLISQMGLLPS